MRTSSVVTGKITLVISVAASLALPNPTALPGAERPARRAGMTVDLDQAIFRSDTIATAELASIGDRRRVGMATYLGGITLKPSAVHKGGADRRGSSTYSLTVWDDAAPRPGEEYIAFLSKRRIIELMPKTDENLRELAARLGRPDDVLEGIDRRLPGNKLDLDAAVGRSDVVETASIRSEGFVQQAGSSRMMIGIVLEPSRTLKGAVEDRGRASSHLSAVREDLRPPSGQGYYMDVSGDTVVPTEDCIFFISKALIIKVLRKTEPNLRAVEELTRGRPED